LRRSNPDDIKYFQAALKLRSAGKKRLKHRFRSGSEILFADVGGTEDPSAPVHVMAAPLAGGLPRLVLQDVGMKGKVTVLP